MTFPPAQLCLCGPTSSRTARHALFSSLVRALRATGRRCPAVMAAGASGLFFFSRTGAMRMTIGIFDIEASLERDLFALGIWADLSTRFVLVMAGPFILSIAWGRA